MSGVGTVRVVLVDDHTLVRAGLRDVLEGEPDLEVVGEAGSVREAVEAAETCQPDVVVMDVQLPDGNGVEATREIRSRRPETRVVMFTAFPDEEARVAAVLAGASAYVMKHVRGSELVRSIRAVAAGACLVQRDVDALMARRAAGERPDDDRIGRLTAQERKILDLIPAGKTNKEIAAELHLSEKTVKNYVSTILMKLRVTRRAEAAAYVIHRTQRSDPPT